MQAKINIIEYIKKQLEHFFPDGSILNFSQLSESVENALTRLKECFRSIRFKAFTKFDYLHTDQYAMFLYILSNELFSNFNNIQLATKVMYLNKALHGINCMYDADLPPHFLFVHTVGTVIGKAVYGDYLVVFHQVTIGASHSDGIVYPRLQNGVTLFSNTSVIGNCNIGNNVTLGIGTRLYKQDVPDNNIVYQNGGRIIMKPSPSSYSDLYFFK